jgi:signal transduction histidine kinase
MWFERQEDYLTRYRVEKQMFTRPEDHASAVVPLQLEGQLHGVLALNFAQPRSFSDEDKALLMTFATECAQAVKRAQLYSQAQQLNRDLEAAMRQLQHEERIQRMLAEIGSQLTASLSVSQRLQIAAQLVAGQLADWCTIEIVGRDGELAQVATAHADESLHAALAELHLFYPPRLDSQRGIAHVLACGKAELHPVIDEGVLGSIVRDERHAELLQTLGFVSVIIAPLRARGGLLGTLSLMRGAASPVYDADDLALAQDLADRIGLAVDNARMYEDAQEYSSHLEQHVAERTQQLEASNAQLRASRRQLRALSSQVLTAIEDERARIAHEVHDELGQALTGLKMDIAWTKRKLDKSQMAQAEHAERLAEALKAIDDVIKTVRRIATELRPRVLDDLGLQAAVEWQVEEFAHRTGIHCELDMEEQGDAVSNDIATATFRILQESLTNVARHAQADAVKVRLWTEQDCLKMLVEDNGKGLETSSNGKSHKPGKVAKVASFGLLGMRERAFRLNGMVTVSSHAEGGTRVHMSIPLHSNLLQLVEESSMEEQVQDD